MCDMVGRGLCISRRRCWRIGRCGWYRTSVQRQIKSQNSMLHVHYPVACVMVELHVWSEVYENQGCFDQV